MEATEMREADEFVRVAPIPVFTYGHCLVKVDEKRLFLGGGYREAFTK